MLCYHCGNVVSVPIKDHEFHKDGVYCSRECLSKEMKILEEMEQEAMKEQAKIDQIDDEEADF